jgi:hypothetical protein
MQLVLVLGFYLERIFDREDQKKTPPVSMEAGGAGAELT